MKTIALLNIIEALVVNSPKSTSLSVIKEINNCHDNVVLKGIKENDSPLVKSITIESGQIKIKPAIDVGYDPDITLIDVNGDGKSEIFLNINSGGSGAFNFSYVYEIFDDHYKTLFNFDAFTNRFEGRYLDDYKVEISDGMYKVNIDVSDSDEYSLNEIYDKDGKLKHSQAVDISPVNTVFPYYDPFFKKDSLLVFQKVSGLSMSDGLGYLVTRMVFLNEFQAFSISYQKDIAYLWLR